MTDFLYDAGTNGYIATPFNLETTELNALGTGASATSTAGGTGTAGKFNQGDTASAMFASVSFQAGGTFTPTAGGFIAGWFARSLDGTAFETVISTASPTVPALPRAPDFTIPVYLGGAVFSSAGYAFAQGGLVRLPPENFKVVVQNMSGAALPATGNVIKAAPVAVKY